MDNTSEIEQGLSGDCSAPTEEARVSRASRRKFTRSVVIGSAVFASLGNRAAWGAFGDPVPGCMSVAIFDSFNTTGFASAPPDFDYDLAHNIIAVQNDTPPRQYPNLRVEYTRNQVCIVEVQGDANPGLCDPQNDTKGFRQRGGNSSGISCDSDPGSDNKMRKQRSWIPEQ